MKSLLSIATILFFGISAFSQTGPAGPSLEETYNFLKEKLDGEKVQIDTANATVMEDRTFTFKVKSATGGRLEIVETSFTFFYNIPAFTKSTRTCSTDVTLLLDQVVPSSIKVVPQNGVFSVPMKPTGGNKIRRFASCTSTGTAFASWRDGISEVAAFTLIFNDKEKAEKVAKALSHAVKLNGGKEELF